MKMRIVAIVLLVFLGGCFVGYITPLLMPKETIIDKLNMAGIPFTKRDWYASMLLLTESGIIFQIRDFDHFTRVYAEKNDSEWSLPTWHTEVFLDTDYNVLWIEVINSVNTKVDHIGFYVYTEPD